MGVGWWFISGIISLLEKRRAYIRGSYNWGTGAQSWLDGLKGLAKLFNFVVF